MTPAKTANQNANLPIHRDQAWLEQLLATIWHNHFYDVAALNTVTIKWGRANRNRLGSITAKGGLPSNPLRSEIRINTLLQNPEIPETVVMQTIAHELSHYTHGFCSPHPRKYAHPHRGNVIQLELYERNLADVYNESEAWLKKNWHPHVAKTLGRRKPTRRRTYVRRKRVSLLSNLKQIIASGHSLRD